MARIDELLKKDQTELTAEEIQEIVDYRVSVELQNKEHELQTKLAIAESEARLSMELKALERSSAVVEKMLEQAEERLRRATNG